MMMPGRACFKMAGEMADSMLHGWPTGVKTDLPEDARLVSVYSQHDRQGRLEIVCIIESLEYPPVRGGEAMPNITPIVTRID